MKKLLPLFLLALGLAMLPGSACAQNSAFRHLLDRYYAMKVSLTRDNFDSARLASTEFSSDLSSMHLKGTSKLVASAKKATMAPNIEALRKAFKPVSDEMIALVAKYHTASDAPAYVQYCSMMKAYWLSADEEVRNPYYGKKMLFCGQTKRTIE